ncbi:ser/thr kinase [Raccoonpox virus]|uniref:Ser/Thr Kinase-like protein n=1 Tax=Raccoon poxvirus TaxID=10256 RepID=A0A0G3FXY9_RACVI|nr:Ser/Thr Kinase-like protein [Raccoonpox virus]AKJ93818.1 Ser/Thr Kinase-like protein [Raccoonpox virus]AOP31451.1 ser/thr kinase [Raccoonpox virus]
MESIKYVDNDGKKWIIGDTLYSGNSILYKVRKNFSSSFYSYVMKLDHKLHRPLMSEIRFYITVLDPLFVSKWIDDHDDIKYLAIPYLYGIGESDNYRFFVLKNLGRVFAPKDSESVYDACVVMIDTLEYIHSKGFTHGKIEPTNILIKNNRISLIDYSRTNKLYKDNKSHIDYNEDTIIYSNINYTCIDNHLGAAISRRGELEMLGYCMIEWFGGKLPWKNEKSNMKIERQKREYKKNIDALFEDCFPEGNEPLELVRYMELVYKLDYEQTPDYTRLRKLFIQD